MKKRVLRNVRVLIVEDEPIQLEGIKNDFESIKPERLRKWGINSFQLELAGSVKEAEDLLKAADAPFDILTLDLGLPDRPGETATRPENGQRLLESIKKDKAKEIIVISVWSQYATVIDSIHKGATDFIAKPYPREMLQTRVMEVWKRVLEQESAHILEKRIKELARYHERGLAYHYATGFGKFVSDVQQDIRETEKCIDNKYGLSRKKDSDNPLIKSLVELETRIDKAKQDWMKPQDKNAYKTEAINPILYELERELMPCLIVKNVRLNILPQSNPRIITFAEDVQAVLKELLSGLLADLPDYGSASDDTQSDDNRKKTYKRIIIEINTENKYAQVKISDNLKIMPPEDAKQINDGSSAVSGDPFSRVWGLAVMQHIAAIGGGRLNIEAREQGNVITFMIPLDSNE